METTNGVMEGLGFSLPANDVIKKYFSLSVQLTSQAVKLTA